VKVVNEDGGYVIIKVAVKQLCYMHDEVVQGRETR
jgi:hypothetical protein